MNITFQKTLIAAVTLLAILGALTALTRSEAMAQIRATLVKNIDQAGRTPWEMRSQILPAGGSGACWGTSDCFNYTEGPTWARFDLRPVPAGKRWVVQSATGYLGGASGHVNTVELKNTRDSLVFAGTKWVMNGPFNPYTAFSAVTYTSNLYATFEPGETPTVYVSSTPSMTGFSVFVFSGYLIDATN